GQVSSVVLQESASILSNSVLAVNSRAAIHTDRAIALACLLLIAHCYFVVVFASAASGLCTGGVTPASRRALSSTSLSVSRGTAPSTLRPFTNKAGVALTPILSP